MILLDTSVWIEFLKAKNPWFDAVSYLLENNDVIAFEPIFGELLQGAKSNREVFIINKYWEYLPKVSPKEIWIRAGIVSKEKKLISQGVGLIDVAIYLAAQSYSAKIATLDKKLLSIVDKKFIYALRD